MFSLLFSQGGRVPKMPQPIWCLEFSDFTPENPSMAFVRIVSEAKGGDQAVESGTRPAGCPRGVSPGHDG